MPIQDIIYQPPVTTSYNRIPNLATVAPSIPAVSSASDVEQLDKDIKHVTDIYETIRRTFFGDPADRDRNLTDLKNLVFPPNGAPEIDGIISHLKVLRTRTIDRQKYIDYAIGTLSNDFLTIASLQQQLSSGAVRSVEPSTRVVSPDLPPPPGTTVTTTTTTEKQGMSTGAIVAWAVTIAALGGGAWWYTTQRKPRSAREAYEMSNY